MNGLRPLRSGPTLPRLGVLLVLALVAGGLVLLPAAPARAGEVAAVLVKQTWTGGAESDWIHPSPDPSGITYNSRTGELIISDGEVEETGERYPDNVWMGTNLFTASLGGDLLATGRNTLAYSPEPTGVGFRPTRVTPDHTWPERLFVSDDDAHRVFEVDPGADGAYGTGDDTQTSFDVSFLDLGPEADAEDVAVDLEATRNGQLLIIDGLGQRVFVYNPGPNRVFDGRSAEGGDDFVEHLFDVSVFGAGDPEGIAYNPARHTIFVLDDPSNLIYEFALNGSLLNTVTLPFTMRSGAGLALAPPSDGSSGQNVYIVDRGVDNDSNQDTFNDGRLYEIQIPGLTGGGAVPPANGAPTVDAGSDAGILMPDAVTLNGSVTDDGFPIPAATTAAWSTVSGPGTVTFADATAAATTATFSEAGTYVLRLTGDDGELSASDDVTVTVTEVPEGWVPGSLDVPVRSDEDDAEERGARIYLTSGDLELAEDSGRPQTVGMRFTGVDVPKGAIVTAAWLQFQVDQASTGASDLTVVGQAADAPPSFSTAAGDLSGRPGTAASVSWSFADWPTAGERGEAQRSPNLAPVIQEVIDRGGWATGNPVVLLATGTGERTAESYDGGAEKAPVLHLEWVSDGSGTPPVDAPPAVDAGTDVAVTMPAAATLGGSVTDDGLPDPPAGTTAAWSTVSGPGTATFADGTAAATTATFDTPGTYVLRLTGDDGEQSVFDDVTVTVTSADGTPPVNAPPAVDAGPDVAVTMPAAATLSGSVTDDGLPDPPAGTTAAWSTVSGPGTATFADGTAAATTATFDTPGTYVLRLTGDDGEQSVFDDVTVTVSPEGTGGTPGSMEIPIRASADDAEERGSRIFLSSGDLNLALDGGRAQTVGMRFTGVDVPKGATITGAWIQFQVDEVSTGASELTLVGQAADDPLTFTAVAGDLSGRPVTTASVSWSFADWPTAGERGEAQRTPDLAAVLQELIGRDGWATGNPIVLLISGTGERTAESYDGGASRAPVLHIEWTG